MIAPNCDSRANSLDGLLVPFHPRPSMSSPLADSFAASELDGHLETLRLPIRSLDYGFVPIPKRLRFSPENPPAFGWVLNLTFGLASTMLIANLYYCQPLLIEMSKSFNVSYSQVSKVPTLIQAGYAIGLLFISPLGDILRPRQLMLLLITLSTLVTLAILLTPAFTPFLVFSFLLGPVCVTPQILLPLAADLAPPARRGTAIAICISGLMLGVLVARVLAGLVAEYAPWRTIYYVALGFQFLVLASLYSLLPDYPPRNPQLTYFKMLGSIAKFAVTEPVLIQASLINFAGVACFANFWVTSTFLLGGAPFNFSTMNIGLFGLFGILGVALGPLIGRVTDRLPPWHAALLGTLGYAASQAIQVGAGGFNFAALSVACVGLDVFRQLQQVALTSRVIGLEPGARARLNAVVILSIFLGQVMGTTVGTQIFTRYGWRAGALLSLGWMGIQILLLVARGPHCDRYTWFGYQGGAGVAQPVQFDSTSTNKADIETGPSEVKIATGSHSVEMVQVSLTEEKAEAKDLSLSTQ